METIVAIWRYLSNLEWTEKVQTNCVFCDHDQLRLIYKDEEIMAFENRRLSGRFHWLVVPAKHIRDIESLTVADLPLLRRCQEFKRQLLAERCPSVPDSSVHSGFHRGRRPMFPFGHTGAGGVHWPDIVSVHHVHLHVIVEPRPLLWLFKYPPWLPLMWKSDDAVLRHWEAEAKRQK